MEKTPPLPADAAAATAAAPSPASFSFSPGAIDAETATFNERLAAILKNVPPANTLPPQVTRDAREAGRGPFGAIQLSRHAVRRELPARPGLSGPIPARVFIPETVRGVYLHIHGGGWVFGAAHHNDLDNERIAQSCELAVVSIDYRLAPEHPFPAGPDDCEAAALWLIENARQEFGTDRLLIGGESAGAHLSTLTLLRLRARHGFTGFRGANLVYGAYDLEMSPSARAWGEQNLVLSTPLIRWFCDCFVPQGARRAPQVSPLYADLRGLPPALFSVGTLDPLLDDSLFMHARWLAAGNRAELAVYPGGVHGFNLFPHALARRANQRAEAFLRASV